MLRDTDDIRELEVVATDGVVGPVEDVVFHQGNVRGNLRGNLEIRYLIARRRGIRQPRFLVPVTSILRVKASRRTVELHVLRAELTRCRSGRARPIDLAGRAVGPADPRAAGGTLGHAAAMFAPPPSPRVREEQLPSCVPHRDLLAAREVRGFRVVARDGDLGRLRALAFDDVTWSVRYLIVRSGWLWRARTNAVPPHVVRGIDARNRMVHIELDAAEIAELERSAGAHVPAELAASRPSK